MKSKLLALSALVTLYVISSQSIYAGGLVPVLQTEKYGDSAEFFAEDYKHTVLHYLNEVSSRRRLTTLFPNEQSPFYGVQMNFVNVRKGNLTFGMRDLVRLDDMPIVFGRIYDSSKTDPADFGPGWKLSVVETITRDGNQLAYTDANNSTYELERQGNRIQALFPHLTGISGGRVTGNQVELFTQGLTKVFERSGPTEYRLVEVRDANNNSISLEYGPRGLNRIESDDGRFVLLRRDNQGRVVAARDDADRVVQFIYGAQGLLREVIDLAEGRWTMDYSLDGQLTSLQDPRGLSTLSAMYYDDGRASQIQSQHDSLSFEYGPSSTTARNALQQAVFEHHSSGLTTRARDFAGGLSELFVDDDLRVIRFSFDGVVMAEMTYEAGQLDSLSRNIEGEIVSNEFHYDPAGRLMSVTQDGGEVARYEYDGLGNIVRAQDTDGLRTYEYSRTGRPYAATQGENSVRFRTDPFGRLVRFSWDEDASATLRYDDADRITRLQMHRGEVHIDSNYEYDQRGFRTDIGFSPTSDAETFEISMQYDEVGNVIQFDRPIRGELLSDQYTLGAKNQLLNISFGEGQEKNFQYDYRGQVVNVTTGDQELVMSYDDLGRLSDVYLDQTHMITSDYGPMDLDPVNAADHTRVTMTAVPISSHIFGNQEAIIHSRPAGSPFGPVQFAPSMARFVVLTEVIPAPDALLLASLERRGLISESGISPSPLNGFDKPSNSLFVPNELFSANCATCFKGVSNFQLTRTDSGLVAVGGSATFEASGNGSQCWYSWYDLDEAEWVDEDKRWKHYISDTVPGSSVTLLYGPYDDYGGIGKTFSRSFPSEGTWTVTDDVKCECSSPFIASASASPIEICNSADKSGHESHSLTFTVRPVSVQSDFNFSAGTNSFSFSMKMDDTNLSSSEKLDIQVGRGYWSTSSSMCGTSYSCSSSISWTTNNNVDVQILPDLYPPCGGYLRDEEWAEVNIDTMLLDDSCLDTSAVVVAHEIGHALGFEHRSVSSDIMNSSTSTGAVVSPYHLRVLTEKY